MNLQKAQDRINELMSIFVSQVKGATAMGRTDINRVSETLLIPLFSEIFGYKKLGNLNFSERSNFPGIDLADDGARVAFQITSTSTSEKVKDTLQQFVDHQLFKRYDRLIVYILTDKQKSYPAYTLRQIVGNNFSFNPERDVLDYRDLLKTVGSFQIDKARTVQTILEANFADGKPPLFPVDGETLTEIVHLNLLEIMFPDTLYVADLITDEDPPKKSRLRKKVPYPSRKNVNKAREKVQAALEQLGLRFSLDWETHENKIITFHDLNDHNLPLSEIVDKGTITPLSPVEFYGVNENCERVFKSLLNRCLQQKLYRRQVQWQNEEKLYIFCEVDGMAERVEKWQGKKENERSVYWRTMKNNKPEEILHCKHLAFKTQCKHFYNRWYLLVKPEWFFSRDGYKRSYYGADKVEWLKRQEGNKHVANHLSFIVHFLKYDRPPDLITRNSAYPYLSFGDLVGFDTAPVLNDRTWNPPDIKTDDNKITDSDDLSLFEI
jgi:SMEK domain